MRTIFYYTGSIVLNIPVLKLHLSEYMKKTELLENDLSNCTFQALKKQIDLWINLFILIYFCLSFLIRVIFL